MEAVYTANWVNIYYLPPITRIIHWVRTTPTLTGIPPTTGRNARRLQETQRRRIRRRGRVRWPTTWNRSAGKGFPRLRNTSYLNDLYLINSGQIIIFHPTLFPTDRRPPVTTAQSKVQTDKRYSLTGNSQNICTTSDHWHTKLLYEVAISVWPFFRFLRYEW